MNDQFENLLAPDGLVTRFLYLVLFAVVIWLCTFILIALVLFQFLHLVITGEKNDKVTGFAGDFSAYIGAVSAYLTLASDDKPFPFQDWKPEQAEGEAGPAESPAAAPEPQKAARPTVKPRKKAAGKKTAAKKSTANKTSKKTTGKTVKKSSGKN